MAGEAREVLLVGGAGFVGRHLARELAGAGHAVTCSDRLSPEEAASRLPLGVSYLQAETVIDPVKPWDVIVHLACDISVRRAVEAPEDFIRGNFEPTLSVGALVRALGGAPLVVYLSSDRVYGAVSGALDEAARAAPVEPYGAVKLAGEQVLGTYARMFGFPLVIVRAANLYGPGQSPVQLIPSLVERIRRGETDLRVGDLDVSRNFLFIGDLIGGIRRVIETANGPGSVEVVNFGGTVHTIREVVETIEDLSASLLGVRARITSSDELKRPGATQLPPARLSSAAAEARYGWQAETPLRVGLTKTLVFQGDH